MSFVTAVAYHLCVALPAAFTQPGACLLADPCILDGDFDSDGFPLLISCQGDFLCWTIITSVSAFEQVESVDRMS